MKYTIIFLLTAVLLATGCNTWLDLEPDNERLTQQYWEKEEDVSTTVISGYVRLRKALPRLIQWGEARADVAQVSSTYADLTRMNQQNITSDDEFVKWGDLYASINSANAVIKYASLVLEKDPLFTEQKLDRYVAEAKAIRALAYFYLVRTFGEVPLILEPYVSDRQEFATPKSPQATILNQITTDLRWCMKRLRTEYTDWEEPTSSLAWQNRSRMTVWAAHALLADIFLWNEQYEECIEECNTLINSNRFRLIAADLTIEEYENETWFQLFYPGATEESIFEFYFNSLENEGNTLMTLFYGDGSNYTYSGSSALSEEFNETPRDVRGLNGSFAGTANYFWKYLGTEFSNADATNRRTSNTAANWIVYRYAEIFLMRAEAYAMLDDRASAVADMNRVRVRAQSPALTPEAAASMSRQEFLFEILNDRKKELLVEGKRWYDLVRYAKKDHFAYKSEVLEVLLQRISVNERPIWVTRLNQNESFYLPIHKDELETNKLLVQNPAYK
ncbi:MAG: RagB/SusD family nutrient uptake outer membrane protein [Culturomica sp.]|jgi:hypothetical protein|nr:RagB/SusD family nutrient uptake outer membrane protein [Culturomica sp.]